MIIDAASAELLSFLRTNNMSPSDAQSVLQQCLNMARRSLTPEEVITFDNDQECLIITVDSALSFGDLLELGAYSTVDKKINVKNFPLKHEGALCRYEIKIFQFNGTYGAGDIKKRVAAYDEQHPWMVASATHILTFGAQYPHEQEKYTIVALGSQCISVGNGHCCIALSNFGKNRRVGPFPCGGTLPATHRVLAVRKMAK